MFEEGLELLRAWYHTSEKAARLLGEWKSMFLTQYMQGKLEVSKISLLHSFFSREMALEDQLHPDDHSDRRRRDHLLNAIYIQTIKTHSTNGCHDCPNYLLIGCRIGRQARRRHPAQRHQTSRRMSRRDQTRRKTMRCTHSVGGTGGFETVH